MSRLSWSEGHEIAERAAWSAHGAANRRRYIWRARLARLAPVFPVLLVGVGVVAAWSLVPHRVLGVAALALGLVPVAVFMIRRSSVSGLHSRLMARASGVRSSTAGAVIAAGFTVVMFGAAFLALWSPWR